MDISQRALWVRDWASDLAGFDVEHIRKAFRDWRLSGQTKFPTPGQIMPALRSMANPEKRADRIGAWQPLSDAQYAALSLDAKIRHHQILANQCDVKAGPMWRDGKPADISAMPESWHDWRRKAENHRNEARHLRQIISRVEKEG